MGGGEEGGVKKGRREKQPPLAKQNYAPRIPLPAALAAGFLATAFFAAGLAACFFAATFLAAGFLAATFFAAGLAAAFLTAGFLATAFFATGFLVAGAFADVAIFILHKNLEHSLRLTAHPNALLFSERRLRHRHSIHV